MGVLQSVRQLFGRGRRSGSASTSSSTVASASDVILLCSECFQDHGLRRDAEHIGIKSDSSCPACHSRSGWKLDKASLERLAHRFFVWGTLQKCEYGAAPVVQFNERPPTSIGGPAWLQEDMRRIEKAIGVGFFWYGPRLWMLGEVEPLKQLQKTQTRQEVIDRIVREYPVKVWNSDRLFYRVRTNPENPDEPGQYDSPPASVSAEGGN